MAIRDYDSYIEDAAAKNGLNPDLLRAVMEVESGGNPNAISRKKDTGEPIAYGAMQFTLPTAKNFGINPLDPVQSIYAGAKYLRQNHDRFGGDTNLALAAYNAGPEAVAKYGGIPPFAETRAYVPKVYGAFQKYASLRTGTATDAQPVAMARQTETTPEVQPVNIQRNIAPITGLTRTEDVVNQVAPAQQKQEDEFDPIAFQQRAMADSQGATKAGDEFDPIAFQQRAMKTRQVPDVGNEQKLWALRNPDQAKLIEQMSPTEKALVGAGYGLVDTVRGVRQAGAELQRATGFPASLPQDADAVQRITQEGMQDREAMGPLLRSSPAAQVGEVLGRTAPTLPIPGGVAGNAATRALTSALGGAGLGAASFVEPGESRAQNAALGGAAGTLSSLGISGLSRAANTAIGPKDTKTRRLSQQWDIPLTAGEEATGASSRGEVFLERLPGFLGIKGFRARQLEKAHNAAKNMLSEYIADPAAADIMSGNRAFVDSLYQDVRNVVSRIPNQAIDATQTQTAAQQMLRRYPNVFKTLQDSETEKIIRDIADGTSGPLTFDEAWKLRQGIGRVISQTRKQAVSGAVDESIPSQFKAMFGAITNDMDSWAGSIGRPDLANRFKAANSAYQQYVVKYDLLQRAYDKSMKEVGDETLFSPAKFSNNLDKLVKKEKWAKNFSEAEKNELAGLANILQVAKRSGQYLENPPTGQRYGALAVLGGLEGLAVHTAGVAGGLKTGAAIGGVGFLGKVLTTTETGKRLALAASKIEPDSVAMKHVITQVMKQMPKMVVEYSQSDESKLNLDVGVPEAIKTAIPALQG